MKRFDGIVPDFIIIGAMRAATTTLYRLLSRHPRIGMSKEKETDFFADPHYKSRWSLYHAQFKSGFDRYGEASPNYSNRLLCPGVAGRIQNALPDVKLIYILRDPVDRLISHYRHLWLTQYNIPEPDCLRGTRIWDGLVDTSRYHRQIEAYEGFFERGQMLILDFEQVTSKPVDALREIGRLVGICEGWNNISLQASENSTAELSHIPGWLFKFQRDQRLRLLKRMLPQKMRRGMRRAFAIAPPREVPSLSDDLLALARDELARDADALRQKTGLSFPHWNV